MEEKKTQQKSEGVTSKQALNFIGDIKAEFKKVSWTTPEELRVYTKVVVTATFVFGMGVYFMDVVIQGCLTGLNTVLKVIAG